MTRPYLISTIVQIHVREASAAQRLRSNGLRDTGQGTRAGLGIRVSRHGKGFGFPLTPDTWHLPSLASVHLAINVVKPKRGYNRKPTNGDNSSRGESGRKVQIGLVDLRASAVAEGKLPDGKHRSEERRVGKECRSRWSP